MCALMDAQITDAEWEAQRKRNKLLHDCKTKGFDRLKKLGQFSGGIELSKNRSAAQHLPIEFATLGAKMVNEDGRTIKSVCDEFGREHADLRYYCNKFGIELEAKRSKRRSWDYDATYTKIRRMVNEHGYRLSDVGKKLDASPALLMKIIKTKGRIYDAKKIKIRKQK